MSTYLIYATEHDGEHEHSYYGLVKAESEKEALKVAKDLSDYFQHDDTTTVEIDGVREITFMVGVMLQGFGVANYMHRKEPDDE